VLNYWQLIVFFLSIVCISNAQAAYNPLTFSNGSTSFSNISNVILNGNILISNPATSTVRYDLDTLTSSSSAEFDIGNCGAANTVDWNSGARQRVTLNAANCTISFTAPTDPTGHLLLKVIQDGTGGRTVTWPGTVNFPNGTGVTLSTGGGARDFFSCYYDGTEYFCTAAFNF
jgi:hypothetical protein